MQRKWSQRARDLKKEMVPLILKTHSGTETPARRFGMTEPLITSVRSMPSSDKSKERSSSAERLVSLKVDAVVK